MSDDKLPGYKKTAVYKKMYGKTMFTNFIELI